MTRGDLFRLFFFLHIVGVMIGLGPTFAFSRLARLGREEPEHALFALRVTQALTRGLVIPLAALVFLSGAGMILAMRIDLLATGWLLTSVVLFTAAFSWSVFGQNRALARVLSLSVAGGAAATAAAELRPLRARLRYGGIYLRVSAVAILLLMVFKPF